MIAFRDDLPLIILPNGQAVAFDRDWLARALNLAAHRCGYAKWWLADHVAGSVQVWLKTLDDQTVLPVAQLTRAERSALQVIGYAEVGERFEAAAPFARISLVEIAQEAGNCFELGFFGALSRRLQDVLNLGGSYCELHGLEACVKLLQHKKVWCRDCETLRAEIVTYAREHTGLARCATLEQPHPSELFLYVA
jgi:hypothetical protein